MNTGLLNRDTFAERYPEQKPVCLNYATVREDMLALIEEIEALRSVPVEIRRKNLVILIAEYLTDWTGDEESCMSVGESINRIEGYGQPFGDGSSELVTNAIRHFIDVVNPCNKSVVPDILIEMGFTETECEQYWS